MGNFTLDLSRLVEKAKGKTDLAVRKVMLETFSKVIYKSPVDTGRFRSNWLLQYGAPNLSTTLETDKSGGSTVGRVAADIQSTRLDGKSIFLTNSLDYSITLENGSSKQAPQGMVRLSIIEITAKYGR